MARNSGHCIGICQNDDCHVDGIASPCLLVMYTGDYGYPIKFCPYDGKKIDVSMINVSFHEENSKTSDMFQAIRDFDKERDNYNVHDYPFINSKIPEITPEDSQAGDGCKYGCKACRVTKENMISKEASFSTSNGMMCATYDMTCPTCGKSYKLTERFLYKGTEIKEE